MKFQKLIQLAVLASSFQAYQFAVAGDADFTLTNKTGYDLESVYVAPSKSKEPLQNPQQRLVGTPLLL
jgi:hypothetical protein